MEVLLIWSVVFRCRAYLCIFNYCRYAIVFFTYADPLPLGADIKLELHACMLLQQARRKRNKRSLITFESS